MIRWMISIIIVFVSAQADAFNWQDLWSTPDQQGQVLMNKNQFSKAKDTFERDDWAAAAAYKSGDYEHAADLFKEQKTEQGYYNQGNALAHMGQYEKAIESYDKALALNPMNQDAEYNRKLVKDLMKKDKEKQQNKDQQNKDQQNKDQQNKDQQNKDQQNKDQQNKDQQNKDQQNKDQQNKDQQNKDQNKDQQNKDQQNKDQQDKDQQNKEQQQAGKDKAKKDEKTKEGETQSEALREKQQAKEQWLRLIPDDPGGLMREKFLRDHLRRERGWYQ